MVVAVGAAICWAAGSLYQRQATLPHRPFVAASMQMLVAGGVLLLIAAISGELGRIDAAAFSRASVLAVAYLIVFGSWLGFTSYLWVLRNAQTSLVSTYAYVTPVGAVLLGAVILNETITARTLLAGALIVIAVAIIITAGNAARASDPGQEASDSGREASDPGQERGAELEPEGGLERVSGAEERGFGQDGRGELQADGEPT
jgi:drug/metabolite transporter (DMT)-like permease